MMLILSWNIWTNLILTCHHKWIQSDPLWLCLFSFSACSVFILQSVYLEFFESVPYQFLKMCWFFMFVFFHLLHHISQFHLFHPVLTFLQNIKITVNTLNQNHTLHWIYKTVYGSRDVLYPLLRCYVTALFYHFWIVQRL